MAKRRRQKKTKKPEKNKGGNGQRAYKTEADFREAAESYFWSLKKKDAPNKSGLCLVLNISRETLNQYKKLYPDTTSYVNETIKNWWIGRLSKSSPIGAIFYLKNFDPDEFKDRTPGEPGNPFTVTAKITGMKIIKDK